MRSSENVELNLNILKKIVIAMNQFLLAAIVAFIYSDNVQFWMFEFFSYYAPLAAILTMAFFMAFGVSSYLYFAYGRVPYKLERKWGCTRFTCVAALLIIFSLVVSTGICTGSLIFKNSDKVDDYIQSYQGKHADSAKNCLNKIQPKSSNFSSDFTDCFDEIVTKENRKQSRMKAEKLVENLEGFLQVNRGGYVE